ncbi:MAG: hypothetical protein A2X45_17795 [Lentisphaerae bacterium GWF2_50_93]|nr:MAG: hypothetical protein A2X45_17795 [Lentisphaerae bacterium GWF2_50_93]
MSVPENKLMLVILVGILLASSAVALYLHIFLKKGKAKEIGDLLGRRVRTWWTMTIVLMLATLCGNAGSVIVFGLTSFFLLREFITITPTRRGDHHALFWVFLVIPLQYYLLWLGWYGLFIILIPVYAFLIIPVRMAVSGETKGFLERAAKIQWGLILCVYCISHAPGLLKLEISNDPTAGLRLLVYLGIIAQTIDVSHKIFDKMAGRHRFAPQLNDELCLEGFLLGMTTAGIIGALLYRMTPFAPWQSFQLSLFIAIVGYAGCLCLYAIKKDRGGKGVVIVETSEPMIDRVISLCFAAPVFFHFIRFFCMDKPIIMF